MGKYKDIRTFIDEYLRLNIDDIEAHIKKYTNAGAEQVIKDCKLSAPEEWKEDIQQEVYDQAIRLLFKKQIDRR